MEHKFGLVEPGCFAAVDRRRFGVVAGTQEEAIDSVPEEQPDVEEVGYGSAVQYDARRSTFRLPENRYLAHSSHCGSERRPGDPATDTMDISGHGT